MPWSKPEQEIVQHLSHIHPLVTAYGESICDGCNTHGNGKTYRCAQCDYDLHDCCATCPPTLLSLRHPQHVLQLVFNVPDHNCDICDGSVEGFFYRCKACDFDVHPLCTGLPQHVSHVPRQSSHGCGHTNQGQGNVPRRRSKRRIMLQVLKEITVAVVTNVISSALD